MTFAVSVLRCSSLLSLWSLPTLFVLVQAQASVDHWLEDPISHCRVWSPEEQGNQVISWSGDCENGKAHGSGVLSWFSEGALVGRFEGTMLEGQADGLGEMFLRDEKHGSGFVRIEGEFLASWVHGFALIEDGFGGRFEGTIDERSMTGHGIWQRSDGTYYDGPVKTGLPEGQGYARLPNGTQYRGSFVAGKAQGQGEMLTDEGDYYRGEFSQDLFHGQGFFEGKDGTRYEGGFRNDLPNGNGVFVDADGTRYRGRFKAGRPDGEIQVEHPDGSHSLQNWINGEQVES